MSRAAEMRVRKSDDRRVVILITGTVFIGLRIVFSADIVRLLIRVGRKLHRPERHRRARICVSHFLRADQRVDVLDITRSRLCEYNG